ncbi:hypothetical protein HY57_10185 [Dyella japonica A8]|uniref:Uncharacterized protein n=2 Tax=Dyella japonica TaxID=231455 RepID=A0A075K0D7_9GAMM|nr:hypothetical protein HY57_10185 [Dyella japonica A8]
MALSMKFLPRIPGRFMPDAFDIRARASRDRCDHHAGLWSSTGRWRSITAFASVEKLRLKIMMSWKVRIDGPSGDDHATRNVGSSGMPGHATPTDIFDLTSAQYASTFGSDSEVRAKALAIYYAMMSGTHQASPPFSDRMRLMKDQDDRALLLHVAIRGAEVPTRAAALARLERELKMAPPRSDTSNVDTPSSSVRARSALRRSIVTVVHEIEHDLSAGQMLDVCERTEELGRLVGEWPSRWPLPGCVSRVCRLLQGADVHERLTEIHARVMSFNLVCNFGNEMASTWWEQSGFVRLALNAVPSDGSDSSTGSADGAKPPLH